MWVISTEKHQEVVSFPHDLCCKRKLFFYCFERLSSFSAITAHNILHHSGGHSLTIVFNKSAVQAKSLNDVCDIAYSM